MCLLLPPSLSLSLSLFSAIQPTPTRPIIMILGRLHGHGAGAIGGCRNAVATLSQCCRMVVGLLSDGLGTSVASVLTLPCLITYVLCSHTYVLVIVPHRVRVRGHSLQLCVHWACLRCCGVKWYGGGVWLGGEGRHGPVLPAGRTLWVARIGS